ncbi:MULTISPECIES: potassium-transporting ATPase subunit KdpA [unclassified Mucilaginibacter]|uniref:potassium-transporting ATPase subunit KdpA n=3 Tax=Mucilaginibacter TaxID=423349 RepID=UPI002AC9837E|nr:MULTISPECIES: potassium-transporting ATPase subunit KdpA [unclassified Mucilaginibacter]MEB0248502.1 potassium-transporting ATPase subunit KdpA [Mucilaginibacter sp. 5B2]MEB0261612.1 potassium-transporting ATPase subunit KdpA [Mucilaginibacter sp. 10I4]MEB0280889.1 potassium-transporting ATPase subunit KdpA [Mucilaginibacter sp. 10B2]WPX23566.1 potassium-transporting ATPase subunit KdpA [Mucilaginibacter sp. 5C4]WPX24253.1 potassium-transporting ATPase subunit KdpA [Mucilaginibacter sp. 5C4
MNTELFGIIASFALMLVIGIPLGKYLAKMFAGEKVWTDFMKPVESGIYKLSGINPNEPMTWKQFLKAMMCINLLWLVYGFFVLMHQDKLPLNPDGNPGMTADLAFNSIISFVVNCNLQQYSGESGASYLVQHFIFMFLQFVSAATGIACAVGFFKAFRDKTTNDIGNFWNFFLKAITRLLLPLSIVVALILTFNGTPSSYAGKDQFISLQGDTVHVSRGPAAQFIAIKHLGTNGGGWFGANSTHPLENPNYLTNITEIVSQMIIPIAMVLCFGYFIRRKKLGWIIFGVMMIGALLLLIPSIGSETGGNTAIAKMGIAQPTGAMEGKEVRIGPTATAFWSTFTTIVSTGSVNGMHDSTMPLTGLWQLLGMMINGFFGGCGVGVLNYFIYLIIAVFISGLMVGRTPEFLGHKVEAREVKIAALITLLSPFLIMAGTALAAFVFTNHGNADWAVKPSAWLNNPSFHGFSEMLYEMTSANANNGSGFEGLGDNNIFWNVSTGFVMLLGRFLPIIGPVAIAGLLAQKKYIPESAGTLKVDTVTFGLMTFAVILVLNALSYFPALALGPIAEFFSMPK